LIPFIFPSETPSFSLSLSLCWPLSAVSWSLLETGDAWTSKRHERGDKREATRDKKDKKRKKTRDKRLETKRQKDKKTRGKKTRG